MDDKFEKQNPTEQEIEEKDKAKKASLEDNAWTITHRLLSFFPLDRTPVVKVKEKDKAIAIEVSGEKSGLLIGKQGQTLDAIELVLTRMLQHKTKTRKQIELDVEDYRKRRIRSLEQMAEEAAQEVIETKKSVKLGVMPARDRRIIHLKLKGHPDVVTESEGPAGKRQVVVKPR